MFNRLNLCKISYLSSFSLINYLWYLLVMYMKMEVYLFDHFENILKRFTLVHTFVKQKIQLVVYKQYQFNLNLVRPIRPYLISFYCNLIEFSIFNSMSDLKNSFFIILNKLRLTQYCYQICSKVDYLLFIAQRKSRWTQVCGENNIVTSALMTEHMYYVIITCVNSSTVIDSICISVIW